jgi:hypothetical protein
MLVRMQEEGMLLQCWWGYKLVQSLLTLVWKFLKTIKTELPYDPVILPGLFLKECKSSF